MVAFLRRRQVWVFAPLMNVRPPAPFPQNYIALIDGAPSETYVYKVLEKVIIYFFAVLKF